MADSEAVRSKRKRHHQAGLHDLCSARCRAVREGARGDHDPGEPLLITGGVGPAVDRLLASAGPMGDYHGALAEIARQLAMMADTDPVRRIPALRELRAVLAHWEQPTGAPGSALDRARVARHSRRLRLVLGQEIAGGPVGD